ncbi:divalent-cation tolerance protein CutA [Chloroflexota bacterium]
MEKSDYIVVLITTDTGEEARQISKALLEQKKAACVNIIPKVDSLFRWDGEIDSAHERLLIVKSKASLLPDIVNLVKGLHSYTVPEIIALPIVGGNQNYLEWIGKSVS